MKKLSLLLPILLFLGCISVDEAKSNTLREIDFNREAEITCDKNLNKMICTVITKQGKISKYVCDLDKCDKI